MGFKWRSISLYPFSALAAVLAAACGSGNGSSGGQGQGGNGSLTQSAVVANGAQFTVPLDAAPSPDGSQVYFVGVQGSGAGDPAVFHTAATGGTPTVISSGGNLGSPLGIAVSSDGSKLFLADPAATSANDKGAILSLPSGGGSASALTETADYAPRALTVAKMGGSDDLYFIGDDKADGTAGVFKDSGGAVTPVIKTGNPVAVAVASDGMVYVLDAAGSVSKIAPGATAGTPLAGASQNLTISFPAGMDLSQDGSALLVSGFDPASGKESIARVDVASGAVKQLAVGLTGTEPAGLHRAANADVYAFADVAAGSSGTVYLLKK